MDLQTLRAGVRRLLGEQVAADSYWADADIDFWVNRAHEEVVVLGELLTCTSKANSKAAVAATMPEDGQYTTPTDVVLLTRAFYKQPTGWKRLEIVTITDLDLKDAEWFTKIAAAGSEYPTHLALDGQSFHLYPAANEVGASNILLWGIQSPATLTNPTDAPKIPVGPYQEAIIYGAAKRALYADRGAGIDTSNLMKVWQGEFDRLLLVAKSQHLRKPGNLGMRDIRDFYPTETGWRNT